LADVKWIKITTDIFDDEKILLIESLPDAYSIIVVWFKLLCLAGKQNNSGVFIMNNQIAYTDKMLATIFRMKETTVQLALQTFQQFGMVEIVDGVITIPNWGKHQNLDQLESKKQYMRNYMKEYREKQKLLTGKSSCKTNCKANVSQADKDIDRDIEREEDIDTYTVSKDTVCPTDVRRILEKWNELGISQLKSINSGTNRYNLLKKRIKDYGADAVVEAIERIRQSEFLLGQNKDGWVVTFDWFIKPNNFLKVFEGNYDKRQQAPQTTHTGGMKRGQTGNSDPGEADDGRYGVVF